jgi:hypothetical protein
MAELLLPLFLLTPPHHTMASTLNSASPANLPPNTVPLTRTNQLAGLLTIIRDDKTTRGDFIFYSDRIIR